MERSKDFKIIKHLLTKYGFNEIGKNNSHITYFINDKGVRTLFIDREDNFSYKYLIELSDQLNLDSKQFIHEFMVIREMINK